MSDLNAFSLFPSKPSQYHVYDMKTFMDQNPRDHSMDIQTPMQFTAGTRRIVNALQKLYSARQMNELCGVMPEFSRDLIWSAPLVLMSRKGHVRVSFYLQKFFADLELEPSIVKVHGPIGGSNKHLVEIEGTVWVKPHRSWLLLPTMLLPKAVPLAVRWQVGVDGPLETGKIELVYARLANLPSAIFPVRSYLGVLTGAIPHLTEPIWGLGMELLGDQWYGEKRRRMVEGVTDVANDYGHTAYDYAMLAVNKAQELTGTAVDTAKSTANYAIATTQETARQAYDTTAGLAQGAYDTTTSLAQGAYETAADTTNRVIGTTQEAARQAYDTTAEVANKAYTTSPADVVDTTVDQTKRAAHKAYNTSAADVVDSTADQTRKVAHIAKDQTTPGEAAKYADRTRVAEPAGLDELLRGTTTTTTTGTKVPITRRS